MKLNILPLSERPDLKAQLASPELIARWPRFMLEDPTANLYFAEGRFERFFEFMLVVFDEAHPDKLLGRALSVPFAFGDDDRPELPDGGWDTVVRWADQDAFIGRTPNTVSALELTLHPDASGQGVSARVLEALKENAARHGFGELVAPVRPNQKHRELLTPMHDYVHRTRADGLPTDPWWGAVRPERQRHRAGGARPRLRFFGARLRRLHRTQRLGQAPALGSVGSYNFFPAERKKREVARFQNVDVYFVSHEVNCVER